MHIPHNLPVGLCFNITVAEQLGDAFNFIVNFVPASIHSQAAGPQGKSKVTFVLEVTSGCGPRKDGRLGPGGACEKPNPLLDNDDCSIQ